MTAYPIAQTGIVNTSRGLTIAGTRITLYQVLEYLKAEWPLGLVQQWLNLTEQQLADVLEYIATHRDEVEADYQLILAEAEESRQY